MMGDLLGAGDLFLPDSCPEECKGGGSHRRDRRDMCVTACTDDCHWCPAWSSLPDIDSASSSPATPGSGNPLSPQAMSSSFSPALPDSSAWREHKVDGGGDECASCSAPDTSGAGQPLPSQPFGPAFASDPPLAVSLHPSHGMSGPGLTASSAQDHQPSSWRRQTSPPSSGYPAGPQGATVAGALVSAAHRMGSAEHRSLSSSSPPAPPSSSSSSAPSFSRPGGVAPSAPTCPTSRGKQPRDEPNRRVEDSDNDVDMSNPAVDVVTAIASSRLEMARSAWTTAQVAPAPDMLRRCQAIVSLAPDTMAALAGRWPAWPRTGEKQWEAFQNLQKESPNLVEPMQQLLQWRDGSHAGAAAQLMLNQPVCPHLHKILVYEMLYNTGRNTEMETCWWKHAEGSRSRVICMKAECPEIFAKELVSKPEKKTPDKARFAWHRAAGHLSEHVEVAQVATPQGIQEHRRFVAWWTAAPAPATSPSTVVDGSTAPPLAQRPATGSLPEPDQPGLLCNLVEMVMNETSPGQAPLSLADKAKREAMVQHAASMLADYVRANPHKRPDGPPSRENLVRLACHRSWLLMGERLRQKLLEKRVGHIRRFASRRLRALAGAADLDGLADTMTALDLGGEGDPPSLVFDLQRELRKELSAPVANQYANPYTLKELFQALGDTRLNLSLDRWASFIPVVQQLVSFLKQGALDERTAIAGFTAHMDNVERHHPSPAGRGGDQLPPMRQVLQLSLQCLVERHETPMSEEQRADFVMWILAHVLGPWGEAKWGLRREDGEAGNPHPLLEYRFPVTLVHLFYTATCNHQLVLLRRLHAEYRADFYHCLELPVASGWNMLTVSVSRASISRPEHGRVYYDIAQFLLDCMEQRGRRTSCSSQPPRTPASGRSSAGSYSPASALSPSSATDSPSSAAAGAHSFATFQIQLAQVSRETLRRSGSRGVKEEKEEKEEKKEKEEKEEEAAAQDEEEDTRHLPPFTALSLAMRLPDDLGADSTGRASASLPAADAMRASSLPSQPSASSGFPSSSSSSSSPCSSSSSSSPPSAKAAASAPRARTRRRLIRRLLKSGEQLTQQVRGAERRLHMLHEAIHNRDWATFQLFMKTMDERTINEADSAGRTPLSLAASMGQRRMVAALLKHPDIDVFRLNDMLKTAVTRAREVGEFAIAHDIESWIRRRYGEDTAAWPHYSVWE